MIDFTTLFLVFLFASLATQVWLAQRQMHHVQSHRAQVPADFEGKISLQDHQKAADYTLAKVSFGRLEMFTASLLLLVWTLGGGIDTLDQFWRQFNLAPTFTGIAVMFSLFLIMALLDLPFNWYRTFVIEQRFGFNRSSQSLFWIDTLKSTLLLLLIGAPLLWVVLWLMETSGGLWWLYVWAVLLSFGVLMNWAYPVFIAPIFNKFKPLEDEQQRQRIDELLQRCGFTSKGIFIMDGSRRSSHGNAYFSGMGNNKRIVFFDTLANSLSTDELEAVLAHELGHFRHKHIRKRLFTGALLNLAAFALLGWLMQQEAFYHELGVSQPSTYAALLLFVLVSPLFSLFLSPLLSASSRKHEFEADSYAAEQTNAQNLISALVTLYQENASTLTPDPLYSAFYDSHPPAPVRIDHLRQLAHG